MALQYPTSSAFPPTSFAATTAAEDHSQPSITSSSSPSFSRALKQESQEQQEVSTSSAASSLSTASSIASSSSLKKSSDNVLNSQIRCVNANCSSPASASTNYLCSVCFEEQKRTLIERNYTPPKQPTLKEGVTASTKTVSTNEQQQQQLQKKLVENGDKKEIDNSTNFNSYSPLKANEIDTHNGDKMKIYSDSLIKDGMPREYCIPNSL
mgnify:CR=1 FL=1